MTADGGGADDRDTFRRAVERRSAPALLWLLQAPKWLLPLAMAGMLLGGLVLSGPGGAALLGLLAVFVMWLAFIAWPTLHRAPRVLRCVVIAIIFALALVQLGLF